MNSKKLQILVLAILFSLNANSQNVTTYAGKQYLGSGDFNSTSSNLLLEELFSIPMGICADNNNRLWVTDQHNVMILNGPFSLIRGGFLGDPNDPGAIGIDNGTASVSRFNMPSGLAINKSTNDVYIVDTDNALIRKGSQFVNTPNGTVFTTIAGNYSFVGDHKDGLVADAYFSSPSDIAINSSGEMYICDFGNEVIRKISSGKVTTIAGKPKTNGDANGVGANAMFYAPSGIWLENDNSMLIADRNNKKIKRLNLKTNEVTTVISSGLNLPTDVVSVNGLIYIADQYNIKVFDGTTVKIYAGQDAETGYKDGLAKDAFFGYLSLFTYRPADSAFFICDTKNNVIRRLTLQTPPVVDFSANKTSVNVGQTVSLVSNCKYTQAYSWSIIPNTYSVQANSKLTDKNIFVSFSATGSYTISLEGSNSSDKSLTTKNSYIKVSNISNLKPIANFVADITNPIPTQTIRLVDLSENTPTAWNWTISPATFSYVNSTSNSSRNPEVKFSALGLYSVTLSLSNSVGTDQITKTNYITVVLASTENSLCKQVFFYPNPSRSQVKVMGIDNIVNAELWGMDGKKQKICIDKTVIDLSFVLPGVYYANVLDNLSKMYKAKIVVIH
ncbi:MAG: hypothetical protein EXR17_05320 [Flavobacteriaceae bacterium]|nr:hypothetical protein [Flavobacteriaceae bacterium]